MIPSTHKGSLTLVIACLALALSAYALLRTQSTDDPRACIDQEARAYLASQRRTLAERDAVIARLTRAAASAPDSVSKPIESNPVESSRVDTNAAEPSRPPETPLPTRRPQYAHFETANPAVSMTQNADGTYDIRSTDPSLAGSVMQVTAVTSSGHEDKLLVRIPQ